MGVLRALALVIVASGCTEVVVDPFDEVTVPPPPLHSLGINVQQAFFPPGHEMHMRIPTEGLCAVERIDMTGGMTGTVPFYFPEAIEPDVTELWVAIYVDFDGVAGCEPRIDFSEFMLLPLTVQFPEARLTQGEIYLEVMDPVGSGDCAFFETACETEMP
jgi:hypothetical protein